LTDGIWSECAETKDGKVSCSTIRRNLQREYLKKLTTMVIGNKRGGYGDMFGYIFFYGSQEVPADARSLARLHLQEIGDRIGKPLQGHDVDDTTPAHLEECRQRIAKVLDASLDINEP